MCTCCTAFQKASVVCAEISVVATAAYSSSGDHHGKLCAFGGKAVLVEDLADGEQRGLGVQRVEDGLHQQQVDTAGEMSARTSCL